VSVSVCKSVWERENMCVLDVYVSVRVCVCVGKSVKEKERERKSNRVDE
jgi:hypothetical protein